MGFERQKPSGPEKGGNPELDKVKAALEELKGQQNSARDFLSKALIALDQDLDELGVTDKVQRDAFKAEYVRRFKEVTFGMEERAIAESMERQNWDEFVDHYAQYPPLQKLIDEAKEAGSGDPVEKWAKKFQKDNPDLAGLLSFAISMFHKPKALKEGEIPNPLDTKIAMIGQILSGETPASDPSSTPTSESQAAPEEETQLAANEEVEKNYLDVLKGLVPSVDELMEAIQNPDQSDLFDGTIPGEEAKENSPQIAQAICDYMTKMLGLDGYNAKVTPEGVTLIAVASGNETPLLISSGEKEGEYLVKSEQGDEGLVFDGTPAGLTEVIKQNKIVSV